jgi:hypothetical protein
MLARGFQGRFGPLHSSKLHPADAAFALIASVLPVALRLTIEAAAR